MNGIYTIALLVASNIFMICAWYGHLKLQQMHVISSATPLLMIILFSWLLALPEYALQVPANRIGFDGNGGGAAGGVSANPASRNDADVV